jgi:competence protein ComEC
MANPSPYVAILDVGHGNSTVLRDGACTILVDCGARGSALLQFLKNQGIKEIDTVLISHADQDHIGGLIAVLSSEEFRVKNVYLNSDASKIGKVWDDLTYELSQLSTKGLINFDVKITRGMANFSCGSIMLEVIGPSPYLVAKGVGNMDRSGREITSNSMSASFRVMWEATPIVYLPGDIDSIGIDDLVNHGISFEAPILVFPHHGGKSDTSDIISFTDNICDLTKAHTVIFSIGRNKHENPRPEIVKAIRSKIKDVRIACTQLSKHCANSLPTITPTHLHSFFANGKSKNECCSGTFVIELSSPVHHVPNRVSHQAFIGAVAPTSLCRN